MTTFTPLRRSNLRQPLNLVGILLHQIDEQRSLSIRPDVALLPIHTSSFPVEQPQPDHYRA